MRTALVAVGLALVVALVVDAWWGRRAEARARAEVRAAMQPRVDALRSAGTRHVSLLGALVSFTESRRSRAQLDAEFPTFARGVFAGRGLRALEFVEDSRIVAVWPLAGNEAVLGYDLGRDPDQRVLDDLERALETSRAIFTGPVRLVQGGLGLLVRQRMSDRPGFPHLAAVVIDVPDLLASVGIPDPASGFTMEVRAPIDQWVYGDPAGSAVRPETLTVTSTRAFTVLVAPARGWAVLTARWRTAMRAALALFVLVAALVGWLIGRGRDRLEREMRRSSTALQLVLRANRMGGWEEDLPSGRVRWAPTMDDLVERGADGVGSGAERLLAAVEPPDADRLRAAMARARAGEADEFLEEVRLRAPGGDLRWMLVMGGVDRDEGGRPARLVGVLADASEQRALEERVRHAQRLEALAKLAGGVAHDFNNLLTAIGGFAELARARAADLPPADAEPLRADLDQVLATAARGARLTEQLFTFSRRGMAERVPLDVSASVADLVPTCERLLAGKARIECDLAAGLPRVLLDGEQFTQVLMNLVVNARDAMPEEGVVRLRTWLLAADAPRPLDAPPGAWVVVEVEDEGVGMSPEVRARIFEPYFTTKPMGRGTGLGLSVVHGIVEAAGGSVAVRSVEGDGTTFLVFLPPSAGKAA